MSRKPPVVAKVAKEQGPSAWDAGYGNQHGVRVTPLQAIRRFCWDCMGGHDEITLDTGRKEKAYRPYAEVRGCTSKTCWLYPYRTGRRQK